MSPGNDTTTETLASLSLHTPTIPFDLVPEILCRLPVKLLLQFKCVCKSWKSLISDPKFAKKHLCVSKTLQHHHHLIVTDGDSLLWDSTTSSIFSDTSTASVVPQLRIRPKINNGYGSGFDCLVSSCDGILLFAFDDPLLWNPLTRKFKILPPLLNPELSSGRNPHYTFGYDHFIDNYKVFAITSRPIISVTYPIDFNVCTKSELSVYILGTDSWRRVDDFQFDRPHGFGIFMSGSVNWLVFRDSSMVIVSLDLENESYQTLLMPDLRMYYTSTLGVFRDWLCLLANDDEFFDVWVMKEYGIKESWTKLFSVPYVGGDPSSFANVKVVYVSEDDQVLLDYKEFPKVDSKLVVYNSRKGTFKIPRIRKINCLTVSKVYVESLISPCP